MVAAATGRRDVLTSRKVVVPEEINADSTIRMGVLLQKAAQRVSIIAKDDAIDLIVDSSTQILTYLSQEKTCETRAMSMRTMSMMGRDDVLLTCITTATHQEEVSNPAMISQ